MKPDPGDFVCDLEIRPETATVLNEHSIYTMFDLRAATFVGRLLECLDAGQLDEVKRALWVWGGKPKDESTTKPREGEATP